ncbi:MAG: hypothetical protein J1E62_05440 [Lachnospiraceae bacterium]|nr:hypothetical protein [Lachnospiraceae bacterium]
MGILSEIKKVKRHVKTTSGYQLLSQWTSSQTVEMSDGSILEDKIKSVENDIKKSKEKEKELESTLTWIEF